MTRPRTADHIALQGMTVSKGRPQPVDNRAIFVVFVAKMGAERRNRGLFDGEAEGLIYYILYLEKIAITAFCEKRMRNVGL